MTPPRRILLIHFGQLGDAVMALPAALALRRAYPGAELTVLASAGADAIFRLAGFAPVWTADRTKWKRAPEAAAVEIPRLLWRLRRQRFELSVDLHSFKETNLLAWAAGVPQRVAMLRPTRSLPGLINRKPPPDDPDARLLDRYCAVLGPLGIAVSDRVPRLDPPADTVERIAAGLRGWAGASPILGICPGAGHPGRRWSAVQFAALARTLQAATEADDAAACIVFAGPEEDEALLAPFRALPRTQIWRGLTIPELAAALALCRVVVSNPTGPSHIAAAVGTRLLTLGEIPAFDPVPRPPGEVVALRARRVVPDVELDTACTALLALWRG